MSSNKEDTPVTVMIQGRDELLRYPQFAVVGSHGCQVVIGDGE